LLVLQQAQNTLWATEETFCTCCLFPSIFLCRINAIAFHPMTGYVLTAGSDATAKLWRMDQSGKLQHVWTLTGHVSTGTRLSGHAACIWDVSFSQDGRLAATAADDFTLRVWDLESQSCVHVLEGHEGWVTAVQVRGKAACGWGFVRLFCC
jgi:WD40 repeat protein